LYFLGLSYRNAAAKALSSRIKKRSHIAVWNGCRNINLKEYLSKEKGFLNL
jgi:hypothetical protein